MIDTITRAQVPTMANQTTLAATGVNFEGELMTALPKQNLIPLWKHMERLVPASPNPKAQITLWKYVDARLLLMKAGEIISAHDAERRVLMLANPNMGPPFTTDTIYGGLQLILPNEIAAAHRHSAFALRFVIEGRGGFTAVEGRKMMMEPGDVIVTPSWTWHDHGNEGTEPVIWMDGLDLPMYMGMPLMFSQNYEEQRYPSELVEDAEWRFPWKDVEAAFKQQSGHHRVYHYRQCNGEPLSLSLGAQAEMIAVGHSTEVTQETCSYMYHVYRGSGRTIITSPTDQPERVILWTDKDIFAIPAWSKVQHVNEGDKTAYLFAVTDQPLLNRLGLYRSA